MGKDLRGEKNPFYGKHHSDETKRKLSLAHIGKSPANKGVPQSIEAKEKNRLAHLGRRAWNVGLQFSEESKQKMSVAHLGIHLSESHRHKISIAGMGRHPSEETRQKLHEAQLGNQHNLGKRRSAETKQKISLAMKLVRLNSSMKVPFTNTLIELAIQDSLSNSNISYETNAHLIGRPDLFIKPNLCIFCDGDYWHAYPGKYSDNTVMYRGKKAVDIWDHDNEITNKLQSQGRIVLRFWEHDIKSDPDNCARCIKDILLRN